MKFSFKKTGVLLLVVVIALATLAVGYGAWSEDLNINGTGSTLNLEDSAAWAFTQASNVMWDNNGIPSVPLENKLDMTTVNGEDPIMLYPPTGQDIGSTTIEFKNFIDIVNDSGQCFQRIDMTFNNAYAGYANKLNYHVINCGSVPIKCVDIYVVWTDDFSVEHTVSWTTSGAEVGLDYDGDSIPEITLWDFNMLNTIIEPKDVHASNLTARVNPDAESGGTTYSWIVYLKGAVYW